jgi:two-component system, NarL family, response regulator
MILADRTVRWASASVRLPARRKDVACTSLLIATPDEILRDGFRATFSDLRSTDVVGTASDGYAAIACADRRRPDVALVDLRLTDPSGIETAAAIATASPRCRVILYLPNDDPQVMRRARDAGIGSYLLQGASQDDVLQAVACVAAGADHVDRRLGASVATVATTTPLTDRETTVLELVSHGLTNKTVATRLDISEQTVKTHVKNILGKLQAECRAHAVAMGLRTKLIA